LLSNASMEEMDKRIDRAKTAASREDWTLAERELRAAASGAPNRADLWLDIGFVCTKRRDRAAAIAAYERSLAIHPNRIDVLFTIGMLHSKEGAHDRAIRSFRGVLEIDSTNEHAFREIGCALKAMGRYAEALELFETSIAHDVMNAKASRRRTSAQNLILCQFHRAVLAFVHLVPVDRTRGKAALDALVKDLDAADVALEVAEIVARDRDPESALAVTMLVHAFRLGADFDFDVGERSLSE
jgi:tetratricopeptide (TPR) repeat protein